MQKRVVLDLLVESDWDSAIYSKVGDLLALIEDNDFQVKDIKVEDPVVLRINTLPSGGIKDVAAKTLNKRYRYLSDYDGQ